MKPIETQRLKLRPIDPERDAAFVLEALNDRGFIANVSDREVRTVDAAAAYIRAKLLPFRWCVVELKTSSVPVGSCGLLKRATLDDFDIGYAILDRYSGNGYAFEAAAAMFEYARTELGMKRILGLTSRINTISIHILEKLGLRYEGNICLPGYVDETCLFAWMAAKKSPNE